MARYIKKSTLVGVTTIAIIFFSCSSRRSEPLTGKVVSNTNERVNNGQEKYHRYCQKCHPAGEAGLGPGVANKPGFARRFQVTHGAGVMPSFRKIISKQDVKDIDLYLKHLNRVEKKGVPSG